MNKPGDKIGEWRIVRPLGKGGMGVVYEVVPLSGGSSRALKFFNSTGTHADFLRKRFVVEGKILAKLNHRNLVKVHELSFDEASGKPYFIMDFVLGPDGDPCTLEDYRKQNPLDEKRIAQIYADLRSALVYMHKEGVVHRDIKLENILMDREGRAVLSDFGVSRIVGGKLRSEIAVTTTFASDRAPIMGSAGYLSPELKAGDAATPADDAWATGVLIFRLLTGVWYEEDSSAMELLAGFDPSWETLLSVLLNKDPAKRLPVPPPPSPWNSKWRKSMRVAKWMLLAILAVGAAAFFYMKSATPSYEFDEFFPPQIESIP